MQHFRAVPFHDREPAIEVFGCQHFTGCPAKPRMHTASRDHRVEMQRTRSLLSNAERTDPPGHVGFNGFGPGFWIRSRNAAQRRGLLWDRMAVPRGFTGSLEPCG